MWMERGTSLGRNLIFGLFPSKPNKVILPKTQIFDRPWADSDTTISVVEVYVSKNP